MKQIGYSRMGLLLLGMVGGLVLRSQAAGIDKLVNANSLERIATGFSFTEGPVWHPDGYLLFSDVRANTIYKWTPDGNVEVFRSPSGYSNGLAIDGQGRLVTCEHQNRRISRTELNGTILSLASEFNGERLNSPNDTVVKADGSVYFTDPPWGLLAGLGGPGTQELPFQGVYRLAANGETLTLLENTISRPNGLAFSPDETVLYVASTSNNTVYAYDVQVDGLLDNRRVFAQTSAGPDGMEVDIRGNLYVAISSGIQIYTPEGMHLGAIAIPESTRNCTLGGEDNQSLFITSGTSVYRIQMTEKNTPRSPDFNNDGIVDAQDMTIMVDHWHTHASRYDLAPAPGGDGIVDVLDLIALSEHLFEDERTMAHWKLDETDGDVAYDSVGENHAVVIGDAMWQPEAGQVGGALQFNGIDGYLSAPFILDPTKQPFSVYAWIKGGQPGQTIISQQGAFGDWLYLDAAGTLASSLISPLPPVTSDVVITDDRWHHIGLVVDGSGISLYIDDAEVARTDITPFFAAKGDLHIGAGNNLAPGTFWSGMIDDVRIYDRAVTP